MKECLNCNELKKEINFFPVSKLKRSNICNQCIIKKHISKWDQFQIDYEKHFEIKRFLHLKKINGWQFTKLDIFRIIDYIDFYNPNRAQLPKIEKGKSSPLLELLIKEYNDFEYYLIKECLNLNTRKHMAFNIKRPTKRASEVKYRKTEHTGIYQIRRKFQYHYKRGYVDSFATLEEAVLFKNKYENEQNNQ